MAWHPLQRGGFTGIDWSRVGATEGADPYLVWAEADGFSGYGRVPRRLPLLLALAPGVDVARLRAASDAAWLDIPAVYGAGDVPAALPFCTARVRPRFFREIAEGGALHGLIARFELGLPAGHRADAPPRVAAAVPGAPPAKLRGKVLGLIDGGLAFAHDHFLRDGEPRTRYLWRQDARGVGPAPAGLGYGHELTAADIARAMRRATHGGLIDEDAVYAQFDLPDLRRAVNHGTHVMDLFGGPHADDAAARAPIVAVQLDWATIVDTSGGSMHVHILDGLMYILSRCEPSAHVVVNISWGTLAGPHDGSSVLEAAMDDLIARTAGRLAITVPAGNSYQSRTHAHHTLQPGAPADLRWHVQPDDHTQSFVELWMAPASGAALSRVDVRLTPPGGAPLPWLRVGESGLWHDGGAAPVAGLIFPARVATGTRGTCALVALAPTARLDASGPVAPCGEWRIEVRSAGREPVQLDAYVERDDIAIGVLGRGGRQSYFDDAFYDRDARVDDTRNPTPVRRSGSFNSLSTGARTVSVGGTRRDAAGDDAWAPYSPRRPDPDARRPQRPGVVKMPDAAAPSDESAALAGLRAAGSRSAGSVRLVGTSAAAPQVARRIFNRLA